MAKLTPKQILVANAGTSSLKFAVFAINPDKTVQPILRESVSDFSKIAALLKGYQPDAIGHRIVHGGEKYNSLTLLDAKTLEDLEKLSELAPLHNPPALHLIYELKKKFPLTQQYALFDTAFHHRIPQYAALYAIPYQLSKHYHIKRYGFHGIAHAYSWQQFSKISHKKKVITLHLGSGCSACAIHDGISMDTSMGFTPVEGLIMATRSGDIDPGVLDWLNLKAHFSLTQIIDLLNHQSGLLGLSEKTSNMKELVDSKEEKAKLAIEMFCYRVSKYIGAYLMVLQGVDALIFSGGIGENSPFIRGKIIRSLDWIGAKINHSKNQKIHNIEPGAIFSIHEDSSPIELFVVGSDENKMIAEEILRKSHDF